MEKASHIDNYLFEMFIHYKSENEKVKMTNHLIQTLLNNA